MQKTKINSHENILLSQTPERTPSLSINQVDGIVNGIVTIIYIKLSQLIAS
jgi:hypothetical protein